VNDNQDIQDQVAEIIWGVLVAAITNKDRIDPLNFSIVSYAAAKNLADAKLLAGDPYCE